MKAGSYAYDDDMRELRRADALHTAVKSFGEHGGATTQEILDRANIFNDWLRQEDPAPKQDNVATLRPVT